MNTSTRTPSTIPSLARLGVVLLAFVLIVAVAPARTSAVDYRLGIVAGSFTIRSGERMILTVAQPSVAEIEALLTDPASSAVVAVSEPIVTRGGVAAIVGGADFATESESTLPGPVFRRITLNDQTAYQLNVPTSPTTNVGVLRLAQEGLRAVRVTLNGPAGSVAQTTTFINVVSDGNYAPLSVYYLADVDGEPTLQPDGSTVVGDAERERLRDLRDLLFRKPPGTAIAVRIRPELVDGLVRSGVESDRQLLTDLIEKLRDNAVLVGTFRPTDASSYAEAGFPSLFEAQLQRGETVADSLNGSARTSRTVWLTNEPLNAAGIGLLRDLGVKNVVAFGGAVRYLPPEVDASRPYALQAADDGLALAIADSRYALLLDQPTGTAHHSAVRIAAEILAQREELVRSTVGPVALASRQVVLVAASGTPPEPLVASVVLRLLRRAPQIALRGTSELSPTLDGLARVDPPEIPVVDIAGITERTGGAILAVESVRDLLVSNDGLVDRWREIVDVANDTTLDEAQRDRYLSTVTGNVESARGAVRLPTSSFTFGSRESDLRISLGNSSGYSVSLRLQFTSPTGKIVFDPPVTDVVIPAGGQEEVVVGAQARSNGLIPVRLVLTSPTGTVLNEAEIRIRVNALASLGRGVSALFLAVLAAWWIVHARRNVRKRKAQEHPALRSQA